MQISLVWFFVISFRVFFVTFSARSIHVDDLSLLVACLLSYERVTRRRFFFFLFLFAIKSIKLHVLSYVSVTWDLSCFSFPFAINRHCTTTRLALDETFIWVIWMDSEFKLSCKLRFNVLSVMDTHKDSTNFTINFNCVNEI